MKNFQYTLFFLLTGLLTTTSVFTIYKKHPIKNIIFDIGDVMILTDTIMSTIIMMKNYKSPKTIAYLLGKLMKHGKKGLKDDLYYILKICAGEQIGEPHEFVRDHDNDVVPKILCDWVDGSIVSEKALEIINKEYFDKSPKNYHNKAMSDVIKLMFNSHLLAKCIKVNKDMVRFINFLVQESKTVYNLYILSNYASDAFRAAYKKNKTFLKFIPEDHIFISAEHHCVKPHKKCYLKFLETYHLKAEECLFIDDQETNIKAARVIGMHGIIYDGKHIMKQAAEYLF